MAEEEAPFLPGAEDSDEGIEISFRPRRQYAGYKAFGNGEGAVLLEPRVARELRNAAEFATHDPEPDPSELWTDVVRTA